MFSAKTIKGRKLYEEIPYLGFKLIVKKYYITCNSLFGNCSFSSQSSVESVFYQYDSLSCVSLCLLRSLWSWTTFHSCFNYIFYFAGKAQWLHLVQDLPTLALQDQAPPVHCTGGVLHYHHRHWSSLTMICSTTWTSWGCGWTMDISLLGLTGGSGDGGVRHHWWSLIL